MYQFIKTPVIYRGLVQFMAPTIILRHHTPIRNSLSGGPKWSHDGHERQRNPTGCDLPTDNNSSLQLS